jgi:hypothetical protein
MQQNSINPTHMAPDRCQIIERSGLSDSTYTDMHLTEMSTRNMSWKV